jgi:short/branched chain acyl-CoA dehydrogenase
MSFELSEEHESFRKVVRDFATSEVAPHAATWNRTRTFPLDAVRAMGELGLFGLTTPEEYGGAGGDLTTLCVAIEEIGRVDQSLGVTLEADVSLGVAPLIHHGSREQKERWLPDLAAGRALAAFGLTEAESGSDARGIRTTARLDDGEWIINGSKQFITNSGTPITSVVTVAVRSGVGAEGAPEFSAITVPAGTPGFTVELAYDKLGWHAADTHPLTFTDCRVPADHLLGERGKGLAQFLASLDEGRIAFAALALGCIRGCLEMATAYARERVTFGGPIGSRQGVAFQLADVAVMAEAASALTYRAAWLRDSRRPHEQVKQAASAAKLYASESAVKAAHIASQVFGGYGFIEDHPVARFYRDAKVLEVGEGTSEVQRLVLARGLGLPVSPGGGSR